MHRIFVYGTLRNGEGNFNTFNNRYNIQVIEEGVPVEGYAMYARGIPFVCYTGNPNDVIYGDILEVDDEGKEAIDSMELGAGYNIDYVVPEGHNTAYRAYLYNENEIPTNRLIESGNFKEA